MASTSRPVPATTPYRRPAGNRRAKTSNTQSRSAVPSAIAACSMVSSYWSVSSAVDAVVICESVGGSPAARGAG